MKNTTTKGKDRTHVVTNKKQYIWAIMLFMLGLVTFLCLGFIVRFLMSLIYPG